jgi:hypothetical protein
MRPTLWLVWPVKLHLKVWLAVSLVVSVVYRDGLRLVLLLRMKKSLRT